MGIRPHLQVLIGVNNLRVTKKGNITDKRAVGYRKLIVEHGSIYDVPWFEQPVQETLGPGSSLICLELRRKGKIDFDNMPVGEWLQHPDRCTYQDIFVHETEYGLPRVVGVTPPYHTYDPKITMYDDDMLWLMSAAKVFPSDRDKVIVIPQDSPQNNDWLKTLQTIIDNNPNDAEKLVDRTELKILRGETRSFPHFGAYRWDKDFKLAHKILQKLGFDFAENELKLMLYWTWG